MWQPNRAQWRIIWLSAVLLIFAWPADESGSLAVKAVRWLADPEDTLPRLPEPLPMGLGDDGDAVALHDEQDAEYYRLVGSSRWIRTRLKLKAIEDPFLPATERQILIGLGILSTLGVWRLGRTRSVERT